MFYTLMLPLPKKVAQTMTHLNCIREVAVSRLDRKTDSITLQFFVVFLSSFRQMPGSYLEIRHDYFPSILLNYYSVILL